MLRGYLLRINAACAATAAKQIADRYLLGLARRHGGRLITFDRALAVTGDSDMVCLLPAGV